MSGFGFSGPVKPKMWLRLGLKPSAGLVWQVFRTFFVGSTRFFRALRLLGDVWLQLGRKETGTQHTPAKKHKAKSCVWKLSWWACSKGTKSKGQCPELHTAEHCLHHAVIKRTLAAAPSPHLHINSASVVELDNVERRLVSGIPYARWMSSRAELTSSI